MENQWKFTVEEAKSILLNFYNKKMNFHNFQLLGIYEGRPGDLREIAQKVSTLKQTTHTITALLSRPDLANQKLEIECHTTIMR